MFLRNLDQVETLCNGSRLIVTRLANHVISAKIITERVCENEIYIPRKSMSPSHSPWPFQLFRKQFPIIISYML